MKYLKLLMVFLLISILASCIKDKVTQFEAYLINNTTLIVEILPYKSGFVKAIDTIRIYPGDTIQIGDGYEYDDIKYPHFFSEALAIEKNDSIEVIFNDTYSVLHYVDTSEISVANKYYLFEDERNIINRNNYKFIMIRDGETTNLHFYTFTESDYEFAKD